MPKRKKKPPFMWVHVPEKKPKPKISDDLKAEVTAKADALLEEWKPEHIKPPPEDERFNYVVDLYTKWWRGYLHLCAKYACPGPNAISPFFETRFTRLEYVGGQRFNLAYMRHTGQWVEVEQDLSVDACLKSIKDDPWFHP